MLLRQRPRILKSVVFCPVYNEIRAFPALLEELSRPGQPADAILLVNNGSTDGCAELVRRSGLPSIDLPENRGLGYAFMRAMDWAIERHYDVLGVIAANGKMLPVEMHRLLGPVLDGRYQCVTGSRFMAGGAFVNLPPFRRLAIPLVNLFARALTGTKLTDATCGFRAMRLEPMLRAGFDWHAPWLHDYGFEFYVYAKYLLDPSLRCTEVPVTSRYPPRGQPYSKVRPLTGWWSMLRPWLIARFDGKGFRDRQHPAEHTR